jgi:hypothetical protein
MLKSENPASSRTATDRRADRTAQEPSMYVAAVLAFVLVALCTALIFGD